MADCVSSQRFFRLPVLPTLSRAAESSESVLAADVETEGTADPPPVVATAGSVCPVAALVVVLRL